MKKILLSAIAVVALGTAAKAQDMKFGVKAGVNISTYGGDIKDRDSRAGAHVGVLAEFKLTENFAIQPEVVFSMQGADRKFTEGTTVTEDEQRLNYLNIPIAAKYYITEGLSVQAGPQIGFLLSAKQEGTETSPGASVDYSNDNKDAYESVDFSVFGGLGYDLPMGVFFQARYAAGLSNILKDANVGDSSDFKVQNNVFSVSVGYKF